MQPDYGFDATIGLPSAGVCQPFDAVDPAERWRKAADGMACFIADPQTAGRRIKCHAFAVAVAVIDIFAIGSGQGGNEAVLQPGCAAQ